MKETFAILTKNKFVKLSLALYVILTFGLGFLVIYSNDLLRSLLNDYLMPQNLTGFIPKLLLVAGLFIAVFLIQMLTTAILQQFVWGGQKNLLSFYMNRLLRSEYAFFVKNESAEIWSNLNMATQGVSNLFGNFIDLAALCIGLVFYGVVVFSIDFYAGIFTIAIVPVFFVVTVKVSNGLMPLQRKLMTDHGKMSVAAQEALNNVANVKAKNTYNFFVERVIGIQKSISKNQRNVNISMAYIGGISGLVSFISPLLILFVAMQFSNGLTADVGTVMVLYINIPLFLRSFVAIYQKYVMYKAGIPSLNKLQTFKDIPPEKVGGVHISTFETLETKGVKVKFDTGHEISIPDFSIKKGEKIVLCGESGVGKSTIFSCIIGLNPNYTGDIYINGVNLNLIDVEALRNLIGIAFQNTNVLTLDLKDNIALGQNNANIDEVIALTNLGSQSDIKADELLTNTTLSGGEKSRLGLAQTLLRKTEVILIDESFSNLDEGMEENIIKQLFEKFPQKTFVCISHRATSQRFYDRVIDFS